MQIRSIFHGRISFQKGMQIDSNKESKHFSSYDVKQLEKLCFEKKII